MKNLNQYFAGTDPLEYLLDSAAREYLASQLGPDAIKEFQGTEWTLRDTRHIEDCMMYYKIAKRVSGTGDDLTRVRRLFDWIMRQVQLVPAGSFGSGRLGPAFARPYDVLVRGMATESEGGWSERAWLFLSLCRQLDIDTGLITYTKGNSVDAMLPQQDQTTPRKVQRPPVVWVCAALIGDQVYLFDARLGLAVPGPGGQGVATLEQALADPSILERMNIPGLAPYSTGRAGLLASPTKLGILIDSSRGYFAPKMRMLQRELAGNYRAILFSDPAEQRDHFARVVGARAGAVSLWEVPLQVQARLFTDAEYVAAIQFSLFWFKPEFPLIYARVKQLRGDLPEAIEEYGEFRKRVSLPLVTDKKRTIPKEVQDGLDVYATYYLALAQLENNNLEQAEKMFRQVLERGARASARRETSLLPHVPLGSRRQPGPDPGGHEARRDRHRLLHASRIRHPSMPAICCVRASWSGAIRWPSRRSPRPLVPEYRADARPGSAIPSHSRPNHDQAYAQPL